MDDMFRFFVHIATQQTSPTVYSITTNVSNGSYSGDTSITSGSTATVTVSADNGYGLPSSISVIGASYSYNDSTGVISLSNPTGNVIIQVVCVQKVFSITTNVSNGSHSGDTEIYAGQSANVYVTATTGYELPSSINVYNASYSYDSTAGYINLFNPTGNVMIQVVCIEETEKDFVRPNLSSNGILGGSSFAVTATLGTDDAYKAVDGSTSTYWTPSSIGTPDYIFYNPKALKVSSLVFTWYSSSTSYVGKVITVYGSNDNSTYTELVESSYVAGATRTVDVNSSLFYKYYKIQITPYNVFAKPRLKELAITAKYK